MSAAPRRCSACGFEPVPPAAHFCERCGHPVAASSSPPPGPPGSGPTLGPPGSSLASSPSPPPPIFDPATLPARFTALASHPDLPRLLATPPEVPELAGKLLPSLALLLGLTVLGAFAALLTFQLCPPLGFVPLVLVLVAVVATVRRLLESSRAPLTARPAAVIEQRAKLDAGARHSHDHTRHFVTLQLADGERVEREAYASALAALAPGALGVAYEKGSRLAAFVQLPV